MDREAMKAIVEDIAKFFDELDCSGTGFSQQSRRVQALLDQKYGGVTLGAGNFSTVLKLDVLPGLALKVSRDPYDAWLAWAMHCMVYKPRFGIDVHMIYIGADYYLAVMPLYHPVSIGPEFDRWRAQVDRIFTVGISRSSSQEEIMIFDMIQSVKAWEDIRSDNCLQRPNGDFVLSDPIYGADRAKMIEYINKFQTIAQKLQFLFVHGGELTKGRRLEASLDRARKNAEARSVDTVEPLRAKHGGQDNAERAARNNALLQMRDIRKPAFAADFAAIEDRVFKHLADDLQRIMLRSPNRPLVPVLGADADVAWKIRHEWGHGEVVRFLREQFPRQALYASVEQSKRRTGVHYLRISGKGTEGTIAEVPFKPQYQRGWGDVVLRQLRSAVAAGLDRRHHERMEGRQGNKRLRDPRHVFIGPKVVFDPGRLPTVQEMVDLAGWGQGGGQGPPQGAAAAGAAWRPGRLRNDAEGPERLFG